MNHSPAPWLSRDSKMIGVIVAGPHRQYANGTSQDQIITVHPTESDNGSREDNSRLIRFAPEMLQLLLKLENAVEALDGTSVENEALVDAYRALMKQLA